jgi:hypothetical protein
VLTALAVLGSACEVRTTVDVTVEEDGSGTVEVAVGLDAEAMERLPDLDGDGASGPADMAALVRTDDLAAAGWQVGEPGAGPDDLTWIRVSKSFGTPGEADAVMAELTGADGPLRQFHLQRSRGFGSTRFELTGVVDLSGGLEAFGDAGLAEVLDGEPLGEDVAEIEADLGRPLAEAFRLDVTVDLPGAPAAGRLSPRLGDDAQELAATSTVRSFPVLALAGLSALSGLALVAAAIWLAVSRSRRRDGDAGDVAPGSAAAGGEAGEPGPRPGGERHPAGAPGSPGEPPGDGGWGAPAERGPGGDAGEGGSGGAGGADESRREDEPPAQAPADAAGGPPP